VCGAALAASAGGDDATAEACPAEAGPETAARVQARYDGIRDLTADFEQQSRSASFGGQPLMDGDIKRGQVVFAKPGRMRWRYAEPEPSLVVSDGTTMWIHDVEGGTATRLEVTAGFLSGAALQFLLGDGKLLDTFEVEADRCDAARVDLRLRPLEDASYERLGLVADPKTGDILETSVVDLFGNVTVIRFSGMEVDESPPDETFTFDPPEGVELIDYAAEAAGGFDSAAP
jgi:outer membrane lipoprotein carrier protein